VKFRNYFIFIKDLFEVLPSRTSADWAEFNALSPSNPTVVLVSGFGATQRNLSVMRKRFLRDGFNVVIVALDWQSLSDGYLGLYRMAERLSSAVREILEQPGFEDTKVFLVAHSVGGLVARHYLQKLGGAVYCHSLCTLATPHQGTWVAGLGLFTHLLLKARCLFQMLPISQFVRDLNKSSFPPGIPLVSIYSRSDLLCPEHTTELPPKIMQRSETRCVEVPDLSHSDFLLSKSCYRVVLETLLRQLAQRPAGIGFGGKKVENTPY
jgi:pimeloyl-ACP methyl ester carboxylesterase